MEDLMTDLTEDLLRAEIKDLRAENERLTDHRDHYLNQCGTLRATIERLKADCAAVGRTYNEQEAENEALRAEIAKLRDDNEYLEGNTIDELRSSIRITEKKLKEERDLATKNETALRARIAELELDKGMKNAGMYGGTPLDRISAISEFAEKELGHSHFSSEPPELKVMGAVLASRARIAELEAALRDISTPEDRGGAWADEIKAIARAALNSSQERT